MSYFDTVTNDPTLMEISVVSHQVPSKHDIHNLNQGSTTTTSKVTNFLKEQGQYYCRECQRGLTDGKAFDRHLRSELHFKRSLKIDSLDEVKEPRNKVHHTNTMSSTANDLVTQMSKQPRAEAEETPNSRYRICPTCHSTVEKLKFGKHLISHYHHHMSLSANKDKNNELILENIDKIVKECPFQCHICNFFCNWDHDFAYHWKSNHESSNDEHVNDSKMYWCSLCQVLSPTCKEMSIHLNGDYHNEILSVINRCVPMNIKVQ